MVSLQRAVQPWQGSNSLEILLKLESTNPGWSVKARPALNMLEAAERRGILKPGMKVRACRTIPCMLAAEFCVT